ncbi:hypothetical protein BKK81_23460 [Cupriavidus sp. USMAHM13]|uniref:DUF6630 family protein n=1 Tax=Cupriavidus sp. USMAHM13 TaxID=1389192 RepID=UPI0008A68372|nr:hypothetical protein [Cupriavidus sp. USMAHM13]AOZ02245.1 hypothetical protein BKK81_23460 [Cupriavidus sp. USMAHM13]
MPLDDDHDDLRFTLERLLALINLDDPAVCADQLATLETRLDDDPDATEGEALAALIKEVIDWESGFCVGADDTAGFVGCIGHLCARLDFEPDWGVEDPEDPALLEDNSVSELMELVHAQLRVAGYTLWAWDTGGDAYAGWITRSEDDPEMLDVAHRLGLHVHSADRAG